MEIVGRRLGNHLGNISWAYWYWVASQTSPTKENVTNSFSLFYLRKYVVNTLGPRVRPFFPNLPELLKDDFMFSFLHLPWKILEINT